jgi:hypothetical protein
VREKSKEKIALGRLRSEIEIEIKTGYCQLKLECVTGKCVSRNKAKTERALPLSSEWLRPDIVDELDERNFIPLKDQNSCERMKNALGRLITLYGGSTKKDPF